MIGTFVSGSAVVVWDAAVHQRQASTFNHAQTHDITRLTIQRRLLEVPNVAETEYGAIPLTTGYKPPGSDTQTGSSSSNSTSSGGHK